jgi:cytochrome c-type biogenesis protein CcmH
LATLQGGHFGGEPVRHAREALRLDPNQAKALAIAANEASERNDPAAAIAFWERLAALVPPGSAVAKSLAANIAAAREAAAGRD